MKTSIKLETPDATVVSITMQATLGELKRLESDLDKARHADSAGNVAWELINMIRTIVWKANTEWSEATVRDDDR